MVLVLEVSRKCCDRVGSMCWALLAYPEAETYSWP